MKLHIAIGVFWVFIVSCTHSTTIQKDKIETWQTDMERLDAMLRHDKDRKVLDGARQKLVALLNGAAENPDTMQGHYAGRLIDILVRGYIGIRQFQAGNEYLDTLFRSSFLRNHCSYELYAGRARLYQLAGENEKAVENAENYLRLPECSDSRRYIMNAEAISGVYAYCSNDIYKAIQILEKAVDRYRNGGKYPYMMRVISRLGLYYHMVGNYEKATAFNQEAIASYNDSLPPQEVVIAYGEQANLYAKLGLYEQALQYNRKALHYSLLRDSFGLGDVYRGRSEIFQKLGQKDSAFHYLSLGGEASAAMRSFRGVIVNKIELLKACLSCPDSLQSAIRLGWELCPDTLRIPQWAKHQFQLYFGQALLQSGHTEQAITLIERASRGFAAMNMAEMEYAANNILLDYFNKEKKVGAYMYYSNRNRLFADSLKLDEKLRAVTAANIRFATERKEKENELLSAQVKLQRRQIFNYVCISIALLVILGCAITYILCKRKTNNLLVERSRQEIQRLIQHQQKINRHNEQLMEQMEQMTATHNLTAVHQLVCRSLLSKEDENSFRQSFATLYPYYLPKLRRQYPQLTRNEELLAMLICMGQTTDEIALVMGINRSSVNVMRSRMRKNMGLCKEDSLDETVKRYLL